MPVTKSGGTTAVPSARLRLLAGSGFSVSKNGFSFRNYGNEDAPRNLDSATMQALYGDTVCARLADSGCTLTASSAAFMRAINDIMDGGHCFGMAVAAQLIHDGTVRAEPLGGSAAAQLPKSVPVQAMIARYMATQFGTAVKAGESRYSVRALVTELEEGWSHGRDFVLGIYNEDNSGGHAITPIALYQRQDGTIELRVYDNNFPGVEKTVVADPDTNTWTYSTAANPSDDPNAYLGSPHNELELTPLKLTAQKQDCPVCEANREHRTLIFVKDRTGDLPVDVTVTDRSGRRIPVSTLDDLTDSQSTVVSLATTQPFTVNLDAGKGPEAGDVDVAVLGPGWAEEVNDLRMSTGQHSAMTVNPALHRYSWQSTSDSAHATFVSSSDSGHQSMAFTVRVATLAPDSKITIGNSADDGLALTRLESSTRPSERIALTLVRTDQVSDTVLTSRATQLAAGQTLAVNYGNWNPMSGSTLQGNLSGSGTQAIPVPLTVIK